MATHGSLLSRFDAAEYRLCRRLNRGVENSGIRLYFKAASRLGDGVIWYALMLALPFIYGDQGL
jgi:undecaprenyl-diphosphatase